MKLNEGLSPLWGYSAKRPVSLTSLTALLTASSSYAVGSEQVPC